MSFLNGLFARKKLLSKEEQRELAASVLGEIETIAQDNPKKAIAALCRKCKPAYDVLRIGGPMHNEFRKFVERVWARQSLREQLPSFVVEVIHWDNWESPTIRDITTRAKTSEADVLYFTPPPGESHRDAVAELEALRLFRDPGMAMVTVGEDCMFFRRTLILDSEKHLPADSEEIGQEMIDQFRTQGLKVGVVVA